MEDLWARWAENLRNARSAADLTQAELAEALGVSQQAVSAWEQATSGPSDLMKARIGLVLGVNARDLFPLEVA